jgi:hypothetical protein
MTHKQVGQNVWDIGHINVSGLKLDRLEFESSDVIDIAEVTAVADVPINSKGLTKLLNTTPA